MPPSLSHLFEIWKKTQFFSLPSSKQLANILFGANFDQPLDFLLSRLITLEIGVGFSFPLPNLPSKLESLELRKYEFPLPPLPHSLTTLWIFHHPFPINAADTSFVATLV